MEIGNIWIYLYVFLGTIIEVAVYTLRVALTTRGCKVWVAILGGINNIFAITIMILVTTTITTDPLRAIVYGIAYTIGALVGVKLDERLAIGSNFLTIITDYKESNKLVTELRKAGFAFTILVGKGKEKERAVIRIATKRRREKTVLKLINEFSPNSMLIDEVINTQNHLV